MIKITIYKNQQNSFTGFDCTGHAGFAAHGQDIVCAGVSALVINAINSIENLSKSKAEATSDEVTGAIYFRFKSRPDAAADLLMESLILGLEEIQDNYGNKYMFLNFKEV